MGKVIGFRHAGMCHSSAMECVFGYDIPVNLAKIHISIVIYGGSSLYQFYYQGYLNGNFSSFW